MKTTNPVKKKDRLLEPKSDAYKRGEMSSCIFCGYDIGILKHHRCGVRVKTLEKLFATDMRWSFIFEQIKQGIPITVSDRNYYVDKLSK